MSRPQQQRDDTVATLRQLGIAYLVLQGFGAAVWWGLLLLWPAARTPFLAPGAPDVTLLAFIVADLLLFAGASLLSAYGLAFHRPWAWPLLCTHAGAGAYAALYCLTIPCLTGGAAWLGAAAMAPALVVPASLVWVFRPGGAPSC